MQGLARLMYEIEYDIYIEEAQQKPNGGIGIILGAKLHHIVHKVERWPEYLHLDVEEMIKHHRQRHAACYIEKGKRDEQLIDLALEKSPKTFVLLKKHAREKKVERHTKALQHRVVGQTEFIICHHVRQHHQEYAHTLGQIDIFYSLCR